MWQRSGRIFPISVLTLHINLHIIVLGLDDNSCTGYIYDNETGLYYLQSRYYDPEVGRFINADALVSTGQGILGNNPVIYADPGGNLFFLTLDMETHGFLGSTLQHYTGGGGGGCVGGQPITKDDLTPDVTESLSVSISGGTGNLSQSASIACSKDTSGNRAIQPTVAYGATTGAEAGVSISCTVTNAKTVYDLEGVSNYMGFSIGKGVIVSVDVIWFSPNSDPDSTKYGICFGIGTGVALEAHRYISNTETVTSWDIQSVLDWLKE